jgi:transcription antitermination factor NusG
VETTRELHVRRMLERECIEAFVPTIKRTGSYKTGEDTALFKSYVFSRYDQSAFELISVLPFIYGTVRFNDRDAFVEDSEIHRVRAIAEAAQTPLDVFEHLVIGRPVRVISGSFTGCEGVFVKLKGKTRLCVSIKMLGRTVSTEIDRSMVRPIRY